MLGSLTCIPSAGVFKYLLRHLLNHANEMVSQVLNSFSEVNLILFYLYQLTILNLVPIILAMTLKMHI